MAEFRMPSLGADMTEGTLLEWLVGPGDVVHRGDVVAVVDTVKTAIDVETFEDGEVERLLVEPGTTVAVGTPLALLRGAAAVAGQPAAEGPAALAPRAATQPAPGPPVATAPPHAPTVVPPVSPVVRRLARERGVDLADVVGHGRHGSVTRHDVEAAAAPRSAGRVRSSPLARRRAATLGVDLAHVVGTGTGGAVTAADVEAVAAATSAAGTTGTTAPTAPAAPAAPAPPPTQTSAPVPARAVPGTRAADAGTAERRAAMQAATAALMARSTREIPHFYLQTTIDLAASTAWLARHNAGRPSSERVLASALLLAATTRALRAAPELNGFVTDAGVEQRDVVDLGVAVSMRSGGLVVATLHDAGALGVDGLMAALKDLAVRARSGRMRSSEMSTPTITVTNLGDRGADLVHGVIYPPQVALVGFGRVVPRPWAVDGMLAVRPLVVATLAADHRVSDGHRGSRFLAALDAALQSPEEL